MKTTCWHSKAAFALLIVGATAEVLGSDTAALTSSFFGTVSIDGVELEPTAVGSIYWQVAMDDGYPAIGNFDLDDYPEVVVTRRGVRLHEHDGTLVWGPVDLPGAGEAAGARDFDADGEPEIGVAGSTLAWRVSRLDLSGG